MSSADDQDGTLHDLLDHQLNRAGRRVTDKWTGDPDLLPLVRELAERIVVAVLGTAVDRVRNHTDPDERRYNTDVLLRLFD